MKTLFSNLFVVALFVCLSVQYGSGISCYECDDRFPTTPCKNETSLIIKKCGEDSICSTESFPDRFGKNITYERRSCVNITMSGRVKVVLKMKQNVLMYCNTELCNSVEGVTSTKVMLFISAFLSLLFSKILMK